MNRLFAAVVFVLLAIAGLHAAAPAYNAVDANYVFEGIEYVKTSAKWDSLVATDTVIMESAKSFRGGSEWFIFIDTLSGGAFDSGKVVIEVQALDSASNPISDWALVDTLTTAVNAVQKQYRLPVHATVVGHKYKIRVRSFYTTVTGYLNRWGYVSRRVITRTGLYDR